MYKDKNPVNIPQKANWFKSVAAWLFVKVAWGAIVSGAVFAFFWLNGNVSFCDFNLGFVSGKIRTTKNSEICDSNKTMQAQLVSHDQKNPNTPSVAGAQVIKCNFRSGGWIDKDRFKTLDQEKVTLRSPSKKGNEGAVMKYETRVSPPFANAISFLPLTPDKGNLIHGYDQVYRAIIAESNYATFSLEKNKNYATANRNIEWEKVKELDSQSFRPLFRNQIVPNTEILSTMKVLPEADSNSLRVEFVVSYYPISDSDHRTTQTFIYKIGLPINPENLNERIMTGLINPVSKKTSEVDAEFKSCEIMIE